MNINQLKSLIGEFEILVKTISNDSAYIEKMLNCQREIYNGFYEVQANSFKVGDLMFAKFHIHGDGIWIYDAAKFPGDVNSWFTNVI
jgi:hypothetical protein